MGKYKHGKKEELLQFALVKQKVVNAVLPWKDEAFFWLLYYCGVRKSEAYERVASDFRITDTRLVVDFHQRKKRGAEVPPIGVATELVWSGQDYESRASGF
jgi:hypothetical protein